MLLNSQLGHLTRLDAIVIDWSILVSKSPIARVCPAKALFFRKAGQTILRAL
jgi:hypothetical protein